MTPKRSKTRRRRRRPDSVLAVLARFGLPDDFPLSPHEPTGRWYRKIRGKREYFGPLDEPDKALQSYLDHKDNLQAGRGRSGGRAGLTVRQAVNSWLDAKMRAVTAGELKQSTFDSYLRAGKTIVDTFGGGLRVSDLVASDFGKLRAVWAGQYGPTELGKCIGLTRSCFKFAYDAELIEKPVRFGPEFKKPPRAAQRRVRQSKPERLLSAAELRKLIDAADTPLKAMILLGINCGWGNTDVADLPMQALDLKAKVADYPRPKTAIQRRAILWPETVKALREAIDARREPKAQEDADIVFITKYGQRWVRYRAANSDRLRPRNDREAEKPIRGGWTDSVALQFGKLLRNHGIKRDGVNFYALRHCFQTVAEETRDFPAIERIMGHADASMADRYRERIEDDRLKAVAEHVRAWVFGKVAKRSRAKQ